MIRVLNFNQNVEKPERVFELLWTGWSVGGLLLQRDDKGARNSGRLEGTVTGKLKKISTSSPTENDVAHRTLNALEDGTWPILKLSQPEFDLLAKFTDVTAVWNTAAMDEVVDMWDWRDAADKQSASA